MMAGTGGGASMSSKPLSSAPLEANDTGRTNQLFLGCSGPATPQADTKRRAAESHKRVGREIAVRIRSSARCCTSLWVAGGGDDGGDPRRGTGGLYRNYLDR